MKNYVLLVFFMAICVGHSCGIFMNVEENMRFLRRLNTYALESRKTNTYGSILKAAKAVNTPKAQWCEDAASAWLNSRMQDGLEKSNRCFTDNPEFDGARRCLDKVRAEFYANTSAVVSDAEQCINDSSSTFHVKLRLL